MSQYGPGDKPPVVRKRARRNRKPKPPTAAQVQQQTANARPLSRRPVKPKQVPRHPSTKTVQQQAQNARPLSSKPVRPKRVVRPLAQTSKPPRVTRAEPERREDVRTTQRRAAVNMYDQLSRKQKKQKVAAAEKRVKAGRADESDRAILHIHSTRVAGNKKIANVNRALQAVGFPKATDVAFPETAKINRGKGLKIAPGFSVRDGALYDPKGKRVRKLESGVHGGSVANLPSARTAVSAIAPLSEKGFRKAGLTVAANAVADIGELATTSPSSIAKFAVDAVKHPEKVPGQLAAPYKELAKHPGKFIKEHPVSAALMLQPAARVPTRAIGKAARLAGKQTLERPAASLPHTALREERVGSRDVVRRTVQSRKDRRQPEPKVTVNDLHRRVDEAVAKQTQRAERVSASLSRRFEQDTKHMPKKERRRYLAEDANDHISNAVAANKRRGYAEEFGATARVENGKVVEQPKSREAVLHDDPADARKVAEHLNAKNQTIKKGRTGSPTGLPYAKENVKVEYTTRDAGFGKTAVVPKIVNKRLNVHASVGTSKAVPAVLLRHSRRAFSKAVLPYHPTWLSGQTVEGFGVRPAVSGTGPTSWMRAHRLQSRHPDAYKALAEEAVPGGIYGRTIAHEMATRTLKAEIPESDAARIITDLGQVGGIRHARKFNDAVTGFIFDRLNGRLLEGVPQKAMLGRALKRHPLMDKKVLGLSNKAIDEVARGIQNRETMVSLGREVRRTYGQYSGFSPRLRSLIMHWTPFVPWYINMGRFLVKNLPVDHPVAGAVAADIGALEEQWRKENGLSLRYKNENSLPPWMLGGLPVKGSSGVEGLLLGPKGENILRVGQYVPASSSNPTEQAGGMVLPQFVGIYKAITEGRDWKDEELKHSNGKKYNEGERLLYGTAQLLEALMPGLSQVTYAARAPEIIGGPAENNDETLGDRAKKLIRPVSTVRRKSDKGSEFGGFGGSSSGGQNSSGGFSGF